MFRPVSAAALFLLPQFGFAESVGTVDVDLGGEVRTFHTVGMKRDGQTAMTSTFNLSDRLSDLTIQAHPVPRFTSTDVISINASWFGAYSDGAAPASVEVLWLPEGMSKPFYTSDQVSEAPVLEIGMINRDGETGQITGTISATVCRVSGLYEPPDMEDCLPLTGTFDTQVLVKE